MTQRVSRFIENFLPGMLPGTCFSITVAPSYSRTCPGVPLTDTVPFLSQGQVSQFRSQSQKCTHTLVFSGWLLIVNVSQWNEPALRMFRRPNSLSGKEVWVFKADNMPRVSWVPSPAESGHSSLPRMRGGKLRPWVPQLVMAHRSPWTFWLMENKGCMRRPGKKTPRYRMPLKAKSRVWVTEKASTDEGVEHLCSG